ncbi:TPA: tetratricopeptide repeat protein [candidate division WWE3 bacterium]|uniref:Tetratricopeptide repeat protein n=1 Tax=candidate division WWE3 bacterium TaxID=2053526 RepID=A0A656PMX4_UNCKA|nr:hypothetical protein P147_WWE3C00001G0488 [candidate division WWE3 bacterium RAAC2_WWE3_1]KKS55058.1 MAG: hypothetical protein UV21_C0003G0072 [candidate division WWE3 bacterium GW2011_GWD2_42_34]KKT05626.1 MAG: hypothetical protein UV83_C0002G0070 [candidate division WWE3 bacterium GW2011_GWE2_43_18]KKT07085.1 MAG: hypothetical protein UV84_C0002G0070 [candidate division WWE3 bacterium GW2011_GWF2_43_18]KKT08688.1 MAG: hypothetical protein UV87_C0002G0031 [candidate division WWE3 bacterium 
MQLSLAILSKKAIEAALGYEWIKAIELNSQILEKYPNNLETKIRLGRAFIQLKQFEKAKKIFKEVLSVDPINSVALKNLEVAKNKKVELKHENGINSNHLLKEPGTTVEITANINCKGVTGRDFTIGECLKFKIKRRGVEVYKSKKDKDILVSILEDKEIVSRLNKAAESHAEVSGYVIRSADKSLTMIIKSSIPIFRSEKQDIRPYIKKGLDDIDLEDEEDEEEEEIVEE